MTVEQKSRVKDVKQALRMLEKCAVYVGVPAEGADAPAEPGQAMRPNNAVLGYIHEFGAPEHNIPPRPWLVPGVEAAKGPIATALVKGVQASIRAALTGSPGAGKAAADSALHKAGFVALTSVQRRIAAGIAPPLSERTVYARLHRKKRRRTAGKMTPLIDSGQFNRSITYIVRT